MSWTRVGLLAVVMVCLLAAALLLWSSHVSEQRRQQRYRSAMAKGRLLYIAAVEYAMDHQERLPDAGAWEKQIARYLPQGFANELPGRRRYAMNPTFSGRHLGAIPGAALEERVLFFESTAAGPSAHDKLESLPRKGDKVIVVYGSGFPYLLPISWTQELNDPIRRRLIVGE